MNVERTTSAHPDLEALRRSAPAAAEPPRRSWLPRLTGLLIVAGVLGAAYAVLRPVLWPPRTVQVSSVRPAAQADGAPRATAFVQAAGWIEAYPFPVSVRPLVRGVVERIDVLEGTPVTKDETVIAVMRNAELENALTVAKAEVALRDAERRAAQTALAVAESLLEQKIALRVDLAHRQGELATARAAVDRARARRKAAEASLDRAQVDLAAQRDLREAGHAAPTALALAEAAVREAEQKATELRFDEVRFVAELTRITDLLDLAREALAEPRDLQGRVDEARAAGDRAEAAWQRAQADLEVARRNVDLLTLTAPISGIVLRLESAPGAVAGPQGEFKGAGEGAGSTGLLNRLTGSICSLYDPKQLQVRVDVPFADVPGLVPGIAVEVEAKTLPGRTFRGTVDRLVREADISQAKLQVKVRLEDPSPELRPETLCTARFLVQEQRKEGADGPPVLHRVEVPTAALRGDVVFLHDPTGGGRARRVAVRVLRRGENWSEVEGPVGLASKVILDEVEDGEPVKVKR